MRTHGTLVQLAVLSALLSVYVFPLWTVAEEAGDLHPWNISLSAGMLNFEGDEVVEDTFLGSLHLGYDCTDWWTFEGVLAVAPSIDESFRTEWSTGEKVSRLQEAAGPGVHDTWSAGVDLNGLYHFTRWDRLDPYLSVGVGVVWYEEAFDRELEPTVRAGGGVMYHVDDTWALRADCRGLVAGADTEANLIVSGGIMWTMGTGATPDMEVAPVQVDSDGDGLMDTLEVNEYKTDPMNSDSDWDGLTDGEEVLTHNTDPLKRDTDGGGVADGHEVIEDHTGPLDPADDLQLFELHLIFEDGKWDIRSEYFAELDVVGAALEKDPGATSRIEGHTDERKGVSAGKEERLTEKRANAVLTYLLDSWKIQRSRMTAVGYGFSRQKAASDPVNGNADNRRIEVYIRPSPDLQ